MTADPQGQHLDPQRYPIGPMPVRPELTPQERLEAIAAIRALPGDLRAVVSGLDDAALDTPYRDGGWTGRQVVHHVADSHLNAFVRLKLALTEDNPTIKPYEEGEWAKLPDALLPPEVSLKLLDALHARLVAVLEGVTDWGRTWTHPAQGRTHTLDTLLGMYAWHGRHHAAHLRGLRERLGR